MTDSKTKPDKKPEDEPIILKDATITHGDGSVIKGAMITIRPTNEDALPSSLRDATIKGRVNIATPDNEESGDYVKSLTYSDSENKKKRGARVSTSLVSQTLPKTEEEELPIIQMLEREQSLHKALIENNLSEIGANLTCGEWQALIAIPELLEANGAYQRADEEFRATGKIREQDIVVSLQDFLQAYGEDKKVSSRKKIETGGGYQAIEALSNLHSLTKPVAQVWSWSYTDAQGKKHKNAEKIVGGLVSQVGIGYKDLTTGEFTQLNKDDPDIDESLLSKAKYIRIQPSRIFFSRSFLNLPRGVLDNLRAYLKTQPSSRKMTETHYNMAMILAVEAHDKHSTIDKGYKTLLANSGQKKDLKTHNVGRAEKRVNNVLADYEAIGAVKSYRTYQHGYKGKRYEIKIDDKKIRGEQDEAETPKKPKTKRRRK